MPHGASPSIRLSRKQPLAKPFGKGLLGGKIHGSSVDLLQFKMVGCRRRQMSQSRTRQLLPQGQSSAQFTSDLPKRQGVGKAAQGKGADGHILGRFGIPHQNTHARGGVE